MIRTIILLSVAGVALAPFAEDAAVSKPDMAQIDAPWVAEHGVDPIMTSAGSPEVRHLKVATADGLCMISVTNMAEVKAEPACATVYAGLEEANIWLVNGDMATIADASGLAILEVGASDGFAYEGTSASGGIVTLTETDS